MEIKISISDSIGVREVVGGVMVQDVVQFVMDLAGVVGGDGARWWR